MLDYLANDKRCVIIIQIVNSKVLVKYNEKFPEISSINPLKP